MKKQDPKYINVPNICFSISSDTDSRESDFAKQRKKRGFDDSETWCLSNTLAAFIHPRLKRYYKIARTMFQDEEVDF